VPLQSQNGDTSNSQAVIPPIPPNYIYSPEAARTQTYASASAAQHIQNSEPWVGHSSGPYVLPQVAYYAETELRMQVYEDGASAQQRTMLCSGSPYLQRPYSQLTVRY
jgi:hypothetical protein